MLETVKYARKPFYVDAVQVTDSNIAEVAEWCKGNVRTNNEKKRYIKVRVVRPLDDRQTQAFVGDWVLYAGTGFKVYTPKAFANAFETPKDPIQVEVAEAAAEAPKREKKSA